MLTVRVSLASSSSNTDLCGGQGSRHPQWVQPPGFRGAGALDSGHPSVCRPLPHTNVGEPRRGGHAGHPGPHPKAQPPWPDPQGGLRSQAIGPGLQRYPNRVSRSKALALLTLDRPEPWVTTAASPWSPPPSCAPCTHPGQGPSGFDLSLSPGGGWHCSVAPHCTVCGRRAERFAQL